MDVWIRGCAEISRVKHMFSVYICVYSIHLGSHALKVCSHEAGWIFPARMYMCMCMRSIAWTQVWQHCELRDSWSIHQRCFCSYQCVRVWYWCNGSNDVHRALEQLHYKLSSLTVDQRLLFNIIDTIKWPQSGLIKQAVQGIPLCRWWYDMITCWFDDMFWYEVVYDDMTKWPYEKNTWDDMMIVGHDDTT